MTTESQKKILIVEDDRDIRDSLIEILECEGFDVIAAKDGQEALDVLRAEPIHPSLILLDLMMPGRDGLSFREEQEKDPAISGIPVVLMSADRRIELKSSQAGLTFQLKKPIDLDELLETVRKLA